MTTTPNLALPYLDAAQAQKHVTMNEALRRLDALVMLAVADRDLAAPPASPAEGVRYIVAAGASGAWAGHAGAIAAWQDGAWAFIAPRAGFLAHVADESALLVWDGAAWQAVGGGGGPLSELQNLTRLGVGTAADATNPFAAKLNNALWVARTAAEGGDGTLRYKMSKETAAATLSLLMQTNYSGRAEIGLAGDDDFHVKVSPDGATWFEAIRIDRASGRLAFPATGGPREMLTAHRTYYVRSDGSDGNNGLANVSAGAFLTIQRAVDIACALDLNGYNVTIQIADGTYTGAVSVLSPQVGAGTITIQGNNTTPANVLISTGSSTGITVDNGAMVTIKDLKLTCSGSASSMIVRNGSLANISNLNCGAAGFAQLFARDGGRIVGTGALAISGGAVYAWAANGAGASVRIQDITVTITGTPTFSSAFARALDGAVVACSGNVYSGSATGPRYAAANNGVINSGTTLPGNAAGTGTNPSVSPYGLYV